MFRVDADRIPADAECRGRFIGIAQKSLCATVRPRDDGASQIELINVASAQRRVTNRIPSNGGMVGDACIDRGQTLKFDSTEHRTYSIEFVFQVFGGTEISRGIANQNEHDRWPKSGLVDLDGFNPGGKIVGQQRNDGKGWCT